MSDSIILAEAVEVLAKTAIRLEKTDEQKRQAKDLIGQAAIESAIFDDPSESLAILVASGNPTAIDSIKPREGKKGSAATDQPIESAQRVLSRLAFFAILGKVKKRIATLKALGDE